MQPADMNKRPLAVGTRVEAWWDGARYTGTVQLIEPPYPGCAYRHITVIRDSDNAEMETFSDAVAVLPPDAEGT